jgi:hypothetical protein
LHTSPLGVAIKGATSFSSQEKTSIYSGKNDNNNSRDKTTTSRAQYSRNNSSDDNNIHPDHYKQGKQQPDVAPRGDERQE